MVTLVSWKNFLKKKSLWTILSFDQSDKILFIRIDRSLISKVDMKIGEKPIRGRNFYLRERNIDRIDILFFFKLLYSLASYSIIEDTTALSISRNGDKKWRCPFPRYASLFPRGNGEIRVTVSLFCWGKEGKGG